MKTQTIIGGQLYVGPKGASIKNIEKNESLSNKDQTTYNVLLDNGELAGTFSVINGIQGKDGKPGTSIKIAKRTEKLYFSLDTWQGWTTQDITFNYILNAADFKSNDIFVFHGYINDLNNTPVSLYGTVISIDINQHQVTTTNNKLIYGAKGDKGQEGSVADIISDGSTGNVITALSLGADKKITYKKELNALTYLNNKVTVAGTTKDLAKVSPTAVYFPNGIVMGGTAAAAGLTTRGITGVTTPGTDGSCAKEHLYVNYDGNGDSHYTHKLVLGAGSVGTTIPGSTPTNATAATTFTAVRGDQMVAYAMPKAGGTFTGPINFPNATALPQKDLIYICGIDGFANSTKGQMGWQAKSAFLAGYATQSWVRDTAIAHQATSTTGTLTFTGASTATFNGNNSPVVHIPNDAITFSTDPTAKGQILRSMTIGDTTWIIAGTDNNIGVTYEEI